MDKKYKSLIFPIVVIVASTFIGLYEAIVFYKYQTSTKHKTNYENTACKFTIMKSILNILYSIYILHTDVLKKKENKAWDVLKMIIFGINIWAAYSSIKTVYFFTNYIYFIKKYYYSSYTFLIHLISH